MNTCSCGSPMSGKTSLCAQCIAAWKERMSNAAPASATPKTTQEQRKEQTNNG